MASDILDRRFWAHNAFLDNIEQNFAFKVFIRKALFIISVYFIQNVFTKSLLVNYEYINQLIQQYTIKSNQILLRLIEMNHNSGH